MRYKKEQKQAIADRVAELTKQGKTVGDIHEMMVAEGYKRADGKPITWAVVFSFRYQNRRCRRQLSLPWQEARVPVQHVDELVIAILNDTKIRDTKKVELLRAYFA